MYILNYLFGILCGESIDPLLTKTTTLKGYIEDGCIDMKYFPRIIKILEILDKGSYTPEEDEIILRQPHKRHCCNS